MPSCSIIQCGARRNPNQPNITIHRFPQNEVLRQKWLEVIGIKNIKPGLKVPRVCSLHFAESSFNKTLDVIRLRDDAVPSINLVHLKKTHGPVLHEIKNVGEKAVSMTTQPPLLANQMHRVYIVGEPESITSENAMPSPSGSLVLREIKNVKEKAFSITTQPPLLAKQKDHIYIVVEPESSTSENAMPSTSGSLVQHQPSKFIKMQEVCVSQRKIIKRLNEKIRRQGKKISNLQYIITELKKKVDFSYLQKLKLQEEGVVVVVVS